MLEKAKGRRQNSSSALRQEISFFISLLMIKFWRGNVDEGKRSDGVREQAVKSKYCCLHLPAITTNIYTRKNKYCVSMGLVGWARAEAKELIVGAAKKRKKREKRDSEKKIDEINMLNLNSFSSKKVKPQKRIAEDKRLHLGEPEKKIIALHCSRLGRARIGWKNFSDRKK